MERNMKHNKFTEEMINDYTDNVIKLITEQRDNLDNLIVKCEEIRINILNDINNPTK